MSHVRRILSAVRSLSVVHPPSTTRCIPTSRHLTSSTLSPAPRLLPFASPRILRPTATSSPFTRHAVTSSYLADATSPLTLQEEEYSFVLDRDFFISDSHVVGSLWDFDNDELPPKKVAEALKWVRKNLTLAGFRCDIPLAGYIDKTNKKEDMLNALAAAGVMVSVVDDADQSIVDRVREFQSKLGDRKARIILFSGDCGLASKVQALVGPSNLHVAGKILKFKNNYYSLVTPRYTWNFPQISTRICAGLNPTEAAVLQAILRAKDAAETAAKLARRAARKKAEAGPEATAKAEAEAAANGGPS